MAWKKSGVNCIGVKNAEGRFTINPPDSMVIESGMKILVLGSKSQIVEMKKI
jgi:voltage-gated potassium channel